MTFKPATLGALETMLRKRGVVTLGVVGDANHKARKFSYHLGANDLAPGASSASLPRDKAGLSNAASAIDIGKAGGTIAGLRSMSLWLVGECLAGAPDAGDIREIIFSADGQRVDRWDGRDGLPGVVREGPGQGDNSHRTHTHVSFFRDSEARDKLSLFRRYFEEGTVKVTLIKGEDWTPTRNQATGKSNGVLRAVPDRAAPIVATVELGEVIRSIAEVKSGSGNWRLTKRDGRAVYMLRSDWTPKKQGGDPAVDAALGAYIDRLGA